MKLGVNMMTKRNVIEVPLRKVIFFGGRVVTLSLLVEESGQSTRLRWAVSVVGESNYPVSFYEDSTIAMSEYSKRIGQVVAGGATISCNEIYGNLTGYYGTPPSRPAKEKVVVARGDGWRAVKEVPHPSPVLKKTLRLEAGEE